MRETRVLGVKWPQWHTLLFEEQVAVDMWVVCPQDVKKMLLKQVRMNCWEEMAAKHECEELKAGVLAGANPGYAATEGQRLWTVKHRNATRECWSWKEDGCRRDMATLVGRTKKSGEAATRKKERKTQAVPLSVMEGSQEPNPDGIVQL